MTDKELYALPNDTPVLYMKVTPATFVCSAWPLTGKGLGKVQAHIETASGKHVWTLPRHVSLPR